MSSSSPLSGGGETSFVGGFPPPSLEPPPSSSAFSLSSSFSSVSSVASAQTLASAAHRARPADAPQSPGKLNGLAGQFRGQFSLERGVDVAFEREEAAQRVEDGSELIEGTWLCRGLDVPQVNVHLTCLVRGTSLEIFNTSPCAQILAPPHSRSDTPASVSPARRSTRAASGGSPAEAATPTEGPENEDGAHESDSLASRWPRLLRVPLPAPLASTRLFDAFVCSTPTSACGPPSAVHPPRCSSLFCRLPACARIAQSRRRVPAREAKASATSSSASVFASSLLASWLPPARSRRFLIPPPRLLAPWAPLCRRRKRKAGGAARWWLAVRKPIDKRKEKRCRGRAAGGENPGLSEDEESEEEADGALRGEENTKVVVVAFVTADGTLHHLRLSLTGCRGDAEELRPPAANKESSAANAEAAVSTKEAAVCSEVLSLSSVSLDEALSLSPTSALPPSCSLPSPPFTLLSEAQPFKDGEANGDGQGARHAEPVDDVDDVQLALIEASSLFVMDDASLLLSFPRRGCCGVLQLSPAARGFAAEENQDSQCARGTLAASSAAALEGREMRLRREVKLEDTLSAEAPALLDTRRKLRLQLGSPGENGGTGDAEERRSDAGAYAGPECAEASQRASSWGLPTSTTTWCPAPFSSPAASARGCADVEARSTFRAPLRLFSSLFASSSAAQLSLPGLAGCPASALASEAPAEAEAARETWHRAVFAVRLPSAPHTTGVCVACAEPETLSSGSVCGLSSICVVTCGPAREAWTRVECKRDEFAAEEEQDAKRMEGDTAEVRDAPESGATAAATEEPQGDLQEDADADDRVEICVWRIGVPKLSAASPAPVSSASSPPPASSFALLARRVLNLSPPEPTSADSRVRGGLMEMDSGDSSLKPWTTRAASRMQVEAVLVAERWRGTAGEREAPGDPEEGDGGACIALVDRWARCHVLDWREQHSPRKDERAESEGTRRGSGTCEQVLRNAGALSYLGCMRVATPADSERKETVPQTQLQQAFPSSAYACWNGSPRDARPVCEDEELDAGEWRDRRASTSAMGLSSPRRRKHALYLFEQKRQEERQRRWLLTGTELWRLPPSRACVGSHREIDSETCGERVGVETPEAQAFPLPPLPSSTDAAGCGADALPAAAPFRVPLAPPRADSTSLHGEWSAVRCETRLSEVAAALQALLSPSSSLFSCHSSSFAVSPPPPRSAVRWQSAGRLLAWVVQALGEQTALAAAGDSRPRAGASSLLHLLLCTEERETAGRGKTLLALPASCAVGEGDASLAAVSFKRLLWSLTVLTVQRACVSREQSRVSCASSQASSLRLLHACAPVAQQPLKEGAPLAISSLADPLLAALVSSLLVCRFLAQQLEALSPSRTPLAPSVPDDASWLGEKEVSGSERERLKTDDAHASRDSLLFLGSSDVWSAALAREKRVLDRSELDEGGFEPVDADAGASAFEAESPRKRHRVKAARAHASDGARDCPPGLPLVFSYSSVPLFSVSESSASAGVRALQSSSSFLSPIGPLGASLSLLRPPMSPTESLLLHLSSLARAIQREETALGLRAAVGGQGKARSDEQCLRELEDEMKLSGAAFAPREACARRRRRDVDGGERDGDWARRQVEEEGLFQSFFALHAQPEHTRQAPCLAATKRTSAFSSCSFSSVGSSMSPAGLRTTEAPGQGEAESAWTARAEADAEGEEKRNGVPCLGVDAGVIEQARQLLFRGEAKATPPGLRRPGQKTGGVKPKCLEPSSGCLSGSHALAASSHPLSGLRRFLVHCMQSGAADTPPYAGGGLCPPGSLFLSDNESVSQTVALLCNCEGTLSATLRRRARGARDLQRDRPARRVAAAAAGDQKGNSDGEIEREVAGLLRLSSSPCWRVLVAGALRLCAARVLAAAATRGQSRSPDAKDSPARRTDDTEGGVGMERCLEASWASRGGNEAVAALACFVLGKEHLPPAGNRKDTRGVSDSGMTAREAEETGEESEGRHRRHAREDEKRTHTLYTTCAAVSDDLRFVRSGDSSLLVPAVCTSPSSLGAFVDFQRRVDELVHSVLSPLLGASGAAFAAASSCPPLSLSDFSEASFDGAAAGEFSRLLARCEALQPRARPGDIPPMDDLLLGLCSAVSLHSLASLPSASGVPDALHNNLSLLLPGVGDALLPRCTGARASHGKTRNAQASGGGFPAAGERREDGASPEGTQGRGGEPLAHALNAREAHSVSPSWLSSQSRIAVHVTSAALANAVVGSYVLLTCVAASADWLVAPAASGSWGRSDLAEDEGLSRDASQRQGDRNGSDASASDACFAAAASARRLSQATDSEAWHDDARAQPPRVGSALLPSLSPSFRFSSSSSAAATARRSRARFARANAFSLETISQAPALDAFLSLGSSSSVGCRRATHAAGELLQTALEKEAARDGGEGVEAARAAVETPGTWTSSSGYGAGTGHRRSSCGSRADASGHLLSAVHREVNAMLPVYAGLISAFRLSPDSEPLAVLPHCLRTLDCSSLASFPRASAFSASALTSSCSLACSCAFPAFSLLLLRVWTEARAATAGCTPRGCSGAHESEEPETNAEEGREEEQRRDQRAEEEAEDTVAEDGAPSGLDSNRARLPHSPASAEMSASPSFLTALIHSLCRHVTSPQTLFARAEAAETLASFLVRSPLVSHRVAAHALEVWSLLSAFSLFASAYHPSASTPSPDSAALALPVFFLALGRSASEVFTRLRTAVREMTHCFSLLVQREESPSPQSRSSSSVTFAVLTSFFFSLRSPAAARGSCNASRAQERGPAQHDSAQSEGEDEEDALIRCCIDTARRDGGACASLSEEERGFLVSSAEALLLFRLSRQLEASFPFFTSTPALSSPVLAGQSPLRPSCVRVHMSESTFSRSGLSAGFSGLLRRSGLSSHSVVASARGAPSLQALLLQAAATAAEKAREALRLWRAAVPASQCATETEAAAAAFETRVWRDLFAAHVSSCRLLSAVDALPHLASPRDKERAVLMTLASVVRARLRRRERERRDARGAEGDGDRCGSAEACMRDADGAAETWADALARATNAEQACGSRQRDQRRDARLTDGRCAGLVASPDPAFCAFIRERGEAEALTDFSLAALRRACTKPLTLFIEQVLFRAAFARNAAIGPAREAYELLKQDYLASSRFEEAARLSFLHAAAIRSSASTPSSRCLSASLESDSVALFCHSTNAGAFTSLFAYLSSSVASAPGLAAFLSNLQAPLSPDSHLLGVSHVQRDNSLLSASLSAFSDAGELQCDGAPICDFPAWVLESLADLQAMLAKGEDTAETHRETEPAGRRHFVWGAASEQKRDANNNSRERGARQRQTDEEAAKGDSLANKHRRLTEHAGWFLKASVVAEDELPSSASPQCRLAPAGAGAGLLASADCAVISLQAILEALTLCKNALCCTSASLLFLPPVLVSLLLPLQAPALSAAGAALPVGEICVLVVPPNPEGGAAEAHAQERDGESSWLPNALSSGAPSALSMESRPALYSVGSTSGCDTAAAPRSWALQGPKAASGAALLVDEDSATVAAARAQAQSHTLSPAFLSKLAEVTRGRMMLVTQNSEDSEVYRRRVWNLAPLEVVAHLGFAGRLGDAVQLAVHLEFDACVAFLSFICFILRAYVIVVDNASLRTLARPIPSDARGDLGALAAGELEASSLTPSFLAASSAAQASAAGSWSREAAKRRRLLGLNANARGEAGASWGRRSKFRGSERSQAADEELGKEETARRGAYRAWTEFVRQLRRLLRPFRPHACLPHWALRREADDAPWAESDEEEEEQDEDAEPEAFASNALRLSRKKSAENIQAEGAIRLLHARLLAHVTRVAQLFPCAVPGFVFEYLRVASLPGNPVEALGQLLRENSLADAFFLVQVHSRVRRLAASASSLSPKAPSHVDSPLAEWISALPPTKRPGALRNTFLALALPLVMQLHVRLEAVARSKNPVQARGTEGDLRHDEAQTAAGLLHELRHILSDYQKAARTVEYDASSLTALALLPPSSRPSASSQI
ncbi:hypothetical protein BESB_035440 [Besnoitia besnoiti]|uniref:Uncharacterized protein n=1 Tax=Besnoitia besnoiti TaxID=94643 RepID=A0A2A9MLZ3_BESBE|nr:hypothetical protein BESB_035440 [Besnoitia besnoiti]PFH37086.1 hypothetical protein BESB_035440 [Besnoitia besnoiti]